MFMTPDEIHAEYQPLDADRHERGTDTYVSGSSWNPATPSTGGSEWGDLAHNKEKPPQPQYGATPGGGWYNRTQGGGKWVTHEVTESDEDLYARKLSEAQGYADEDEYPEHKLMVGNSSRYSGETYHSARTTTGGGHESSWESEMRYTPGNKATLHEAIGEEGVKSPIRLGQTIGSQGKPEIVGGHHRVASATEHAQYGNWSHQFLPVLHYKNIGEAKSDPTFKYT
jgi:hypothetical protein